MFKSTRFKRAIFAIVFSATFSEAALAENETTLSIQITEKDESSTARLARSFVDNVHTMSNNDIEIELFTGASVVKGNETFNAAREGLIDCDMTTALYSIGTNPAFQFMSDISGGYQTPYQLLAWLYYGGGYEEAQKLYNKYNMQFIGLWLKGPESLVSTKPLRGIKDLIGWKFRSPPGIIFQIFERLGAKPMLVPFNDIKLALKTGTLDGADASTLFVNHSLGLHETAKHTNFPGFHSFTALHLACNKETWDAMPGSQQKIMHIAMQDLALRTATETELHDETAAKALLKDDGVTIHKWSDEDIQIFRETAREVWQEMAAQSPEAQSLLNSHLKHMRTLGLISD